jgi:hypothetical protein
LLRLHLFGFYVLSKTFIAISVVKNGSTRHGKQNYKCRDCGRQFVENPQWQTVSERTLFYIAENGAATVAQLYLSNFLPWIE